MSIEQPTKFDIVMIIDDTEIDIFINSHMIAKNNFGRNIIECPSGYEALRFLEDNQHNISQLPNIIFIDIYMPMMSGFEFMAEYDKLAPELKNHCKVYVISSTYNERDISRILLDANVVGFQEKPITSTFLENILVNV